MVARLATATWLFPQATRALSRQHILSLLAAFARSLANRRLPAAGLFLEFSVSIRVLGLFAGVLMRAVALRRAGRKTVPALAAYLALGFLVTCLCWPGLWSAPVRNYLW